MEAFLNSVRTQISERIHAIATQIGAPVDALEMISGKMLRSRLAGRLYEAGVPGLSEGTARQSAIGTELIHTATLCHDDVIDNAEIRRNRPTLWRATSVSGAILIGDIFLTESIAAIAEAEKARYVANFVAKIKDVCLTEVEQELKHRGEPVDVNTWIHICRGKTGALFAFVGYACAGGDEKLAVALEEAGYKFGAAYQMMDDLLDIIGDEAEIGKTLGTDEKREKFTIPTENNPEAQGRFVLDAIYKECQDALDLIKPWSEAHQGAVAFLQEDLKPVFDKQAAKLNIPVTLVG